jgi:hypothetical protein
MSLLRRVFLGRRRPRARVVPPHAEARARRVRRWILQANAAGLALGVVLTGVIGAAGYKPSEPAAQDEAVAKGWVVVNRPFELFGFDAPAGVERGHSATRHAEGGGRRDVMMAGLIGETPSFIVQFYRLGEEAAPPSTLYVEAARRASEARYWVERTGPVDALQTRFGLVEVADVALAQGERRQHCLAFRFADPEVVERTLRVSGLSCGAKGAAPARPELACQIDHIQLVAAGDDATLRDIFVAAERKRDESCSTQRLAGVPPTAGRAISWLEKTGAPELKRDIPLEKPARGKQAPRRTAAVTAANETARALR